MDNRDPPIPRGGTSSEPNTTYRRARSYSQPVAGPIPGPSHRPPDPLDLLQPSYTGSSPLTGLSQFGPEYDEDAFFRSILAMSEEQNAQMQPPSLPFPQLPPHMAPPPPPPTSLPPQMPSQQQLSNPLVSQTFLAWLQYMQLHVQLQQHQATQQQHPQQLPQAAHQQTHAPFPANTFAMPPGLDMHNPFANEPLSPLSPLTPDQAGGSGHGQAADTPSPPAGENAEGDTTVMAEEKRRRNTAASARFRVKKKQWTLNLERSITDLSGRVEELEREAAELRRENGWLKEIVMLKSKRIGGHASGDPNAQLNVHGSGAESSNEDSGPSDTAHGERDSGGDANTGKSEKGKEVQR